MVLQNVIFPCEFGKDVPELYYRCGKGSYFNGKEIEFEKGAECRFDTVTAAFSIGKWSKYTKIDDLCLTVRTDGRFYLAVYRRYAEKGKGYEQREEKVAEADFFDEVNIELPTGKEGIYYFTLKAETEGRFFDAEYTTSTPMRNKVKLCTVICTYKREEFVKANLETLRNKITENPASPLYGKIKILVTDNGGTLKDETVSDSGDIRIIPNKNTGGPGGFTRGLIEMMKIREEEGITHVLLSDDDIRFESESLLITYAFLSYLKKEYEEAFIGGSMYRTDKKTVQNERADRWDYERGKVVPIGHNLDMSDSANLAINEEEEEINYLSWWYCVMPAEIPTEENLPLPIFIKRDDIEYGLRNGKTFITLNGIFVWHEPFENKRPAFLEYYYNRNQCIMESMHKKDFSAKELKKRLLKETLRGILTFRYNEALAAADGIRDFLKGTEFIKTTDPTKLNTRIMSYNAKPVKGEYPSDYVEAYRKAVKAGKIKKAAAILTLNGWLLPTKKQVTVPSVRPSWKAFYGASSALNVEESTGKCYVTQRSFKEARACLKAYGEVKKEIKRNFEKAKEDYYNNAGEITNIEFWKSYLGITNPLFTENNEKKEIWRKEDIGAFGIFVKKVKLFIHKAARAVFRAACLFIPMKRNRVIFVTTKRKGFACNTKYVALAIKEHFGDKYKTVWVSDYPETCDEVREAGLEVKKINTFGYALAQLKSKTVVYNDSIPSYMPKRKKQVYINTWHGAINYKHIGYDYLQDRTAVALEKFAMRNPQPDYFLSGCRFFTEDTAKSFRFSEGVFLKWGLPRNSLLFNAEKKEKANKKVRETYGLNDEKILIYAPTFRNGFVSDTHGLDFAAVRNAMKTRFGGEWVIFYRGHGFVEGEVTVEERVTDVTGYADMQELIASADAMISDYSSAMWDMIFTGKPIFVYAPDMENYDENERSFAYPVNKWPYPIAESNKALTEKIISFDENEFEERIKKHLEEVGSYEDGKAADKTAFLIEEISQRRKK